MWGELEIKKDFETETVYDADGWNYIDTLEHYRWHCQEELETHAKKDTKNEREGEREREN
jgi:hypothetical protein